MKIRTRLRIGHFLFAALMTVLLSPHSTWSGLAEPIAPAPWSAPLNLSQTAGRTSLPIVQEEALSGDLWVVWTDYTADSRGDILARRRIGSTGVWSTTLNLSSSPRQDEGPALWGAPEGLVHLAWTQRDNTGDTDILYRYWREGGWSDIQILDHTSTYIPSPYGLFFVRDASGRDCLFVTLGSGVRKTCRSEDGWEALSPWVYVPGVRSFGAIISGTDGFFHGAVLGENPGDHGCDPWLDDVYYAATADGISWTVGPNLSAQGSIAYDTALAFDAHGRLHLIWSDISPLCSYDSERSAIYERVLEQGIWGPRREVSVPNEGQAIQDLALARDAAGWLHLTWSEGIFNDRGEAESLTIRYRRWNGLIWGTEEEIYTPSLRSIRVDLVVGRGGSAWAVWEEGKTWQEEVFFSEREKGQWTVYLPLCPASSLPGNLAPEK